MVVFLRYFKGVQLGLRLRDSLGSYYNFTSLFYDSVPSVETVVSLTEHADSSPDDSMYTVTYAPPEDFPYLREVYDTVTGEVVATDTVEAPEITPSQIDAILSDNHGAGPWGAGTVAIPSMAVSFSATMIDKRRLTIKQGDTPRISFNLGSDYTGWTPKFGAKEGYKSSTYSISPKIAVWSDSATGQGYIDLDSSDTSLAGDFIAEIQVSLGNQRLTPLEIQLTILPQVITG